MKKAVVFIILFLPVCIYAQQKPVVVKKLKLLFSDDFQTAFDTNRWKPEMAPLPDSRVTVNNGKLVLDTKGGVTVWLNQLLSGNLVIEYKRTVVIKDGINDRLSDFNQFWMASDPRNNNLFTRNGVLESYDSLLLYYIGMGGNTNKTTRFRKYEGGERKLLQEYTDKAHLLEANKTYSITTVVKNGLTRFYVDGELFFEWKDPNPLRQGYFGFRSTKSHQEIDEIKIYAIE
jgi:rhamnogalacturonan endolyase